MIAVITPSTDEINPFQPAVRVRQGSLTGLEGRLVRRLDGDRMLIALVYEAAGCGAENLNEANGTYIAINAAAVEVL